VDDKKGDIPILGGVGSYLGVTGEVDFFLDLVDDNISDISIICL